MWLYRENKGDWKVAYKLSCGTKLKIGRSATCEIVINDVRVSREHVELLVGKEDILITSMPKTTESLYVNGKATSQKRVMDGCTFSVEGTKFRISPEVPNVLARKKSNFSAISLELSNFLTAALQAKTPVDSLERLLSGLVKLLSASSGYVLLRSNREEPLKPIARYKLPEDKDYWRVSTSICSAAMKSGEIVDVANPTSNPIYGHHTSIEVLKNITRILCLPLMSKGIGIGAIYLEVTDSGPGISKDILSAIADYTSKLLASKNTLAKLNSLNELLRTYSNLYEHPSPFFAGSGHCGKELTQMIRAAAAQNTSVLLLGPTGSGKEMIAREIHKMSSRRNGLFVPVHCASLARSVLEAELFGYEEGAFTGAVERRIGRLELAKGGTLFLDEVGDIPLDVQIMLLRVLQERVCHRVGSSKPIKLDFRLICATNANLSENICEGTFRQDLFYRINVFPINVKSLKERKEDIVPLADLFLKELSSSLGRDMRKLDRTAIKVLKEYSWPGNIRELRNVIERAIIISPPGAITASSLNLSRKSVSSSLSDLFWEKCPPTLEEASNYFLRHFITRVLDAHNGNIASAAQEFGVAKCTLYRKLHKLNLVEGD